MNKKDTSGVLLPPPILYLGFLLLGYVAEHFAPLPFLALNISIIVGCIIIVLSFVIFGLVLQEFAKFETSVDHRKPSTAVISTGPFKYSRNPIYVSMVMLCIRLSFVLNSLWGFVSTFLASVVLYKFVILKEETYLEHKFGDNYILYKASVRRWL